MIFNDTLSIPTCSESGTALSYLFWGVIIAWGEADMLVTLILLKRVIYPQRTLRMKFGLGP
jgi:hypothetical protein